MKKFIFNSMLVGGLMMASCSDDVFEAPEVEKVEKTYAQQFVEKFGPISPEQDWNLAERKSITINGASRAAGDGDVKIYAKYQGVFRLVAHYTNKTTGTLEFDAPEFVDEFLVKRNGEVAVVKNGEVANFVASRTYKDSKKDVFTVHDGYTTFHKNNIVAWESSFAKGKGNVGPGQVANFEMFNNEQGSKVTVYPIYWDNDDTNQYQVFGIYYKNADDIKVYEPIYTSKEGEDLKFNDKVVGYDSWTTTQSNNEYTILSRGFDVVLPNTPFGFYVDVYVDGAFAYKWHSIADDDAIDNTYKQGGKEYSHIMLNHPDKYVIEEGDGSRMISIETELFPSKNNGGDDKEKLDDLFFVIVPTEGSEVTTEDPQSYILAVEDMGKDRDYDFNDIVFSVSYISGDADHTATITPLAAGGVLPAQLYIDGKEINGGKEFHEWFGLTKGANGEYPMVNTFKNKDYVDPIDANVVIPVSENFTLSVDQPAPMGGFSIKVFRDSKWTKEILTPHKGSAPQIICVPADWNWMEEYKEIQLGYPKFGEWGSGYANEEPTNWMNTNVNSDNLYNYFQ